MFRGLYTATSGMLSQQRRMEMMTNNIANANTPGYKEDQSSLRAFPEMFLNRLQQTTIPTERKFTWRNRTYVGALHTGVYVQELVPNFAQGDIRETGNNTDMAIWDRSGTSFFTVQTETGDIRYTRNGHFTVSPEGFLTTAEGLYVLDDAGNPIQVNDEAFTVLEDGTIVKDGQPLARLGIADAQNPQTLAKEGNGLFRSDAPLPLANGYTVRQRYIERSNVDVSRAMTEMLSAYRAFEANQKILQAYDKSMDKAVNEIGRLK